MPLTASRHDYMPFGEEIAATVANRNQVSGFTANDRIRQQFTGYERDGESGLDFAQNRYFAAKHGRFTSVDPLAASASVKNPQTLNRYSYALNSPYKFTDPLGLRPCGRAGDEKPNGDACTQADDGEPHGPQEKVMEDRAIAAQERREAPLLQIKISFEEMDVYFNAPLRDRFFTGTSTIATIQILDKKGNPLAGATVTETNKRVEGTGTIDERVDSLELDSNGVMNDVVGVGEVSRSRKSIAGINPSNDEDKRAIRIGLTDESNEASINETTRQTLSISTNNGEKYEVTWERQITNREDGKPRTQMNSNGLNMVVRYTEPRIKRVD
ncbi:MAG: RHS repeat-associated core domain-containing protein [Acidobacteria bacterium]|nr:RHS repeat-associated core domain-containing protein [Acidobacteriota bacterium]